MWLKLCGTYRRISETTCGQSIQFKSKIQLTVICRPFQRSKALAYSHCLGIVWGLLDLTQIGIAENSTIWFVCIPIPTETVAKNIRPCLWLFEVGELNIWFWKNSPSYSLQTVEFLWVVRKQCTLTESGNVFAIYPNLSTILRVFLSTEYQFL